MKHSKSAIYRRIAEMIKAAFSPAELAQKFGVELRGKADIFDALVREKRAASFEQALELVAASLPTGSDSRWSELAIWSLDYEAAEAPEAPGSSKR
jgi:hypothetical protein